MNIQELIEKLSERMVDDGFSEQKINDTKWILNHFKNYCDEFKIENITQKIIAAFLIEKFDIDYYNVNSRLKFSLRKPLLMIYEFSTTGSYLKLHRKENVKLPEIFKDIYLKYYEYVNLLDNSVKRKQSKLRVVKLLFDYFQKNNIVEIKKIAASNIYNYINSLDHKNSTICFIKGIIRELFNWLYSNNLCLISGNTIFPEIKSNNNANIISYYSKEELEQLLLQIDNTNPKGKRDYLVVCLLVYYGIRIGDIRNLKFENINWNTNSINIMQEKTKKTLSLPIIDEVKFALLDYIKNGRHDSSDIEHILITTHAPYTMYYTNSFFKMITNYMDKANIDYSHKHHGPHSLRHSLATNLMRENVPISAISSILGHSSTSTTEIYLTVDETNLKELTLEVPHE